MNQNQLTIECPRVLTNNLRTYSFLLNAEKIIAQSERGCIVWNMIHTKIFRTNLLAMLHFIFQKSVDLGKTITIKLPHREVFYTVYSSKSLFEIFKYYSSDQRAFFKPRFIGDSNLRETEDILLKYLKRLNLFHYEIIKTIMSELFANIKMHTKNYSGFISADVIKQNNHIVFSIVNGDYSLPYQLELERNMVFETDLNAILWALKKSNSTRKDNESGGLGLYLLRKYIHQIQGEIIICSGHCFLKLDASCFDPNDDKKINIKEYAYIPNEFNGTAITINVPYIIEKQKEQRDIVNDFNLLDILEGKNGLC